MTFIATKPPIEKPPIGERLENDLRDWKIAYIGYGIAHYVLVILGILAGAVVTASSAVATAGEPFMQPIVSAVLGIVAAASVTITNALDTGSKCKRFNKAWVILNEAVIRYEKEPDFPIKDVTNAWVTGQNVILEITEVKKD